MPELDGVRGVAILLVLISHMAGGVYPSARPFLPGLHWQGGGGLMGVQVFFVLSGYLITSILIADHATRGISLRRFYGRRVRRLVPALVVVCAAYLAYAVVACHDLTPALGSVAYAMTYTQNLNWLVPWSDSGWLGHTWPLAIEEQFYLLWPLTLIFALRRHAVARVAIAVIAAVLLARHVVVPLAPERFSHASIQYLVLRWDALMAGCLLAVRPVDLPRWAMYAAVAVMVGIVVFMEESISAMPTWVFTLATAAAFVFVAGAFRTRWLANPALRHLGFISYGLYLWHVLILRVGLPGPVSLAASLVAAELSYRFVEVRFFRPRRGDARAADRAQPVPQQT